MRLEIDVERYGSPGSSRTPVGPNVSPTHESVLMRLSHNASRLAMLGLLAGAAWVTPSNALPPTAVVVGSQYRSWKAGDGADEASVSQGAARTTVRLRFAKATDLILATSGGASRVETGPTESSLTGLSSLTSALLVPFAQDRMLVKVMATSCVTTAPDSRAEGA
jgi:hypothetical protein